MQTEIIGHRGYPLEVHHVVTDEGYILELHRIPYSHKSPRRADKKPVFLLHGLTGSDIVWIMNPTNKALGKLSFKFIYFAKESIEESAVALEHVFI